MFFLAMLRTIWKDHTAILLMIYFGEFVPLLLEYRNGIMTATIRT